MGTTEALQKALDGADTVIHLGAGRCCELPDYIAAASKRIVLVEANPRVARALRAQSLAHDNVHVVQRVISGQAEEATLYVYNVAERSSLRKPTGLLQLYPGLRVVEKIPVTSHSAGSLLTEFYPNSKGKLCLIIETPGEELSILEALVRDKMHERISSLVLRCPRAQMYEGAAARQEIFELLDAQGFEIVYEEGESDLEQVLVLRLNRWKLQNGRLQVRLAKLRDVASKKDAEFQAIAKTSKKQEHNIAELRDIISKKDAEIRSLTEQTKKLEHDSAGHQTAVMRANERTRQMQGESEELQKQLGITLRMQVMRENDLKELQQRYGAVLDLKNSQHKLLMKLRERLSVAAEYLQQLKQENRGDADDEVAQRLVRVLTDGTEIK